MKFKCFSTSILLLLLSALPCCRSVSNNAALNRSALFDPPMVTLQKGQTYHFKEGDLTGSGQVFHSDYSYQNAFLLGLKPPSPNLK